MLIEHSVPNSARMEKLHDDVRIRIWFDEDRERGRFIDIQLVNNYEAVMISHYQAPGGHSYAQAMNLQPNTYNSIVIK